MEARAKWMIVRLCEQSDYRFTDETLLGIICKGRTFFSTQYVREWGKVL